METLVEDEITNKTSGKIRADIKELGEFLEQKIMSDKPGGIFGGKTESR